MKFNNIIFDFDGTLIDSRPGVVKELTAKEVNEKEIVQLLGAPLSQILTVLLNTNDELVINKGINLFKEYYQKAVYQNVVYPGIKEMLESFRSQSRQLFVVSNKIDIFMNKILEQHNLKKYFISILATDGTDTRSKKANHIKYILTHHKLKKKETAIVGDTENDIRAGQKNFIFTIGATWGYGSEFSLVKTKADKTCHTPQELEQFIKNTH